MGQLLQKIIFGNKSKNLRNPNNSLFSFWGKELNRIGMTYNIMSKKSSFGILIGSILLSVTLTAAAAYFFLPMVFPILTEPLGEDEPTGLLLQSKSVTFSASDTLDDSQTESFYLINETETIFTIQNNSRISVLYTDAAYIRLDSLFTGAIEWEIGINVEGIGAKIIKLRFYRESPLGGQVFVFPFTIQFELPSLPAGTYNFQGIWRCSAVDDASGDNAIILGYAYPRTLNLQELAS